MKNYNEQRSYKRAKKRVEKIKGFYWHLFWYLVVNAFILSMAYKNIDPDDSIVSLRYFSTAFFWGIGLAFHAYGVFGKKILFSKEWEERKIKEIMDKDKSNLWE